MKNKDKTVMYKGFSIMIEADPINEANHCYHIRYIDRKTPVYCIDTPGGFKPREDNEPSWDLLKHAFNTVEVFCKLLAVEPIYHEDAPYFPLCDKFREYMGAHISIDYVYSLFNYDNKVSDNGRLSESVKFFNYILRELKVFNQ